VNNIEPNYKDQTNQHLNYTSVKHANMKLLKISKSNDFLNYSILHQNYFEKTIQAYHKFTMQVDV
jgi:hypothetical protein